MKDKHHKGIDDEALFEERADPEEVVERSRHMRSCASCKKLLIERNRDMSKFVLAELEQELGAPVTGADRKLVAKALIITLSAVDAGLSVQAEQMMELAQQAIEQHNAQTKQAEKDAHKKRFYTGPDNVGEA